MIKRKGRSLTPSGGGLPEGHWKDLRRSAWYPQLLQKRLGFFDLEKKKVGSAVANGGLVRMPSRRVLFMDWAEEMNRTKRQKMNRRVESVWMGSERPSVTPQVSVHLNTYHCTLFNLKRKIGGFNSKRRGQIKVKVYKRN